MMNNLVKENGLIPYGIYDEPIDCVNYEDFKLKMPSGLPVPNFLKKSK